MEPSIYSYSLCIALPLMLFFGFYFCWLQPRKKPFSIIICVPGELWGSHTVTCRQLFGTFLFWNQVQEYRCRHPDEPVHLFLCYWLFSSALTISCLTAFISPNVGYGRISVYGYCFPSFPVSFCCCYQKVVYRQR